MTSKALVLLSGGQDSTTALYWAKLRYDEVHAMTLVYGQRHVAEVGAATLIAIRAGVRTHEVVNVPVLSSSGSALVDQSVELKGEGGIPDSEMPQGLPTSFVPGRNLVFLALAAARAGALGCEAVVTGVCQTDYSGYPDCRDEFVQAMEAAVNMAMPSSLRPMRIEAPLMHMTKAQTVILARMLGGGCWEALADTVTCYHGRRPGCGECPACALRSKGFAEAGYADPAGVTA